MKNINYIIVAVFFILILIGAYLIDKANYNGLYFICGGVAVLVIAKLCKFLRNY